MVLVVCRRVLSGLTVTSCHGTTYLCHFTASSVTGHLRAGVTEGCRGSLDWGPGVTGVTAVSGGDSRDPRDQATPDWPLPLLPLCSDNTREITTVRPFGALFSGVGLTSVRPRGGWSVLESRNRQGQGGGGGFLPTTGQWSIVVWRVFVFTTNCFLPSTQ